METHIFTSSCQHHIDQAHKNTSPSSPSPADQTLYVSSTHVHALACLKLITLQRRVYQVVLGNLFTYPKLEVFSIRAHNLSMPTIYKTCKITVLFFQEQLLTTDTDVSQYIHQYEMYQRPQLTGRIVNSRQEPMPTVRQQTGLVQQYRICLQPASLGRVVIKGNNNISDKQTVLVGHWSNWD